MSQEYRYILSIDGVEGTDHEVSREEWVRAERRAGFRPKGEDRGQPATGGFSSHAIRGRIEAVPLDMSDIIAQAAENDAKRTPYVVIAGPAVTIQNVLDFTVAIEPMVMAHFQDLVMDTEQDEELRRKMLDTLAPWAEAVQSYQDWLASQ